MNHKGMPLLLAGKQQEKDAHSFKLWVFCGPVNFVPSTLSNILFGNDRSAVG